MKSSKKALAFALAAAMAITGIPVTNAGAATTTAKLGATKATIYAGNSKYISVSTPSSWKRVKLSVSSSRTSVASVKKNNAKKKIRVDAVKAGTAKVTVKVTAKKSGKTVKKTLSANITVKDYKVRLVDAAGTTVSNTTIDTTVGTAVKLTAKTAPANDKVTFTSDNESVATVDASGNVTPVKAGTVTITAASAKASDKVTINVADKLTDGIAVKLTNPSFADEEKLKDAVLVGGSAILEVTAVADGKPVAGKTVSIAGSATDNSSSGLGDASNYKLASNSAVTGADGKAQFIIQYIGTKSSRELTPVAFNYSVVIPGVDGKFDGAVKFVQVQTPSVKVADTKSIIKSVNKIDSEDGITWTYGTTSILSSNVGLNSQYVNSQQVSLKDTTDHKVTFTDYQPYVQLPGFKLTASEAKNFTDYPVYDAAGNGQSFVSGSYGTYEGEGSKTAHITEIKENPQELTWAQVNFENIRLSEDTKLHVELQASTNGKDYFQADQMVISGPTEQNKATYNVPLDTLNNSSWKKLRVKTWLESYGRVNTQNAGGYTIASVTGVYLTKPEVAEDKVPLTNYKVTWETKTANRSEEKLLTKAQKDELLSSRLYKELYENEENGINKYYAAKMTYTEPSYPYTGNAVVKVYDENNKLTAYYAIPAANRHVLENQKYVLKNKNIVLDYDECYRISEEEATRPVGAIIEDTGTSVTVDSKETGVTSLVGKITDKEGKALPGFDAINDTVYTSVQWCPRPSTTSSTSGTAEDYYALIGQNVKVVAQLKDANRNDVSKAKVPVTFKYNATTPIELADIGTKKLNSVKGKVSAPDITLKGATDEKGQVTLTLKAAEADTLQKLTATTDEAGFNVELKIKNYEATTFANIHWIEANLSYSYINDSEAGKEKDFNYVQKNPNGEAVGFYPVETYNKSDLGNVGTNYLHKVSTDNKDDQSVDQEAKVGTEWEYAVQAGSGDIVISGLKLSVKTSGVGTYTSVADDASCAKVNAKSIKITNGNYSDSITVRLNNTADTAGITMTKKGNPAKYAGEGATVLDKELKINLKWTPSGVAPQFDMPNGEKFEYKTDGSTATVYVSVRDLFKNKVTSQDMKLSADNAKLNVDVEGVTVEGNNSRAITIPAAAFNKNKDGIVEVTVKSTSDSKTILTAKVANETETAIVKWAKADATKPFTTTGEDVAKQTFKNGVVTLTFTKDIVESSVIPEGFQVAFDYDGNGIDKTYDVESASVSGNVITLKLKNYNNDIPTGTKIYVIVKEDATNSVNNIKHNVTSVDGDRLTGLEDVLPTVKAIEINEY